MLGFIRGLAPGASSYRIDEIVKVGGRRKGVEPHLDKQALHMRNDTTEYVHPNDVDRLMMRPAQLLPAEPGCFVVHCDIGAEHPNAIWKAPLIAWALCLDGEIRAVTTEGVNDGGDDPDADIYVEMPDGHIQSVGQYCSVVRADNAQDLLEQLRAQRRRS